VAAIVASRSIVDRGAALAKIRAEVDYIGAEKVE
jgi:hypothetical protein